MLTLHTHRELFTQLQNTAHQRPETQMIEVVEIVEDLYPRISFVNQIAKLGFKRFQLQFTGGNRGILPRRERPLSL
ncbi:hypothetical protein SEEH4388_06228 [Salmonella enterica subsp. enterica serovar Heidelberg str. CVM24388]|nr:hypothetical protein D6P12_17510 [Salmonella enterica subsp. enterica serovar Enteritidis]EYI81659.1 hypothetical protein SEEH4388_06228 [Salmonella enterica subsp. enterica serovar Heidelberg str. CVM24388]